MSESLVLLLAFGILLLLNLFSIGFYHVRCLKGIEDDYQKNKGLFYGKTAYMLFVGITYPILLGIVTVVQKIREM